MGTGVPRAYPVTLARAATVAASLRETIEPTFGPMGGDRLMVNDANQIIITNSGQLILEVRVGRVALRGVCSATHRCFHSCVVETPDISYERPPTRLFVLSLRSRFR